MDATIPCDDMGNLTVPWNWTDEAAERPSQAMTPDPNAPTTAGDAAQALQRKKLSHD
jgi:hypothetical protein